MNSPLPAFRAPTAVERIFNRVFGFLVGIGLGFSYNYLLLVRGRKVGRLYSTPINLLERGGKRFLVAPRGQTSGCAMPKPVVKSSQEGKPAIEIPPASSSGRRKTRNPESVS